MLPILLTVGLAYGIAYWISSTGLAYWRATLGFTVAFVVAWLGGYIISALVASQVASAETFLNLLGKGFWWASISAGFGVYRARFKLRTGVPAPVFKFPSWVLPIVGGVTVVGILAAVALPAYQDYTKRTNPFSDPNFGKPEKNHFDQYDEPLTNVLMPQSSPFSYEEAVAPQPKVQTPENQEHYRQIYTAHPDADEIAESPAFQAWVTHYPVYQGFLVKGNAQEIVGMLTAYKNQR